MTGVVALPAAERDNEPVDTAATDAGNWIVWNKSLVSFSKSSKKKLSLLDIIDADADVDNDAVDAVYSEMFRRMYKNFMQCVAPTQLAVMSIVTQIPK